MTTIQDRYAVIHDVVDANFAAGRTLAQVRKDLQTLIVDEEGLGLLNKALFETFLANLNLREEIQALRDLAAQADAALIDEHEGDLRTALTELAERASACRDLVSQW